MLCLGNFSVLLWLIFRITSAKSLQNTALIMSNFGWKKLVGLRVQKDNKNLWRHLWKAPSKWSAKCIHWFRLVCQMAQLRFVERNSIKWQNTNNQDRRTVWKYGGGKYLLMDFLRNYFFKNEALISWTFLEHFFHQK